MAIRVVGCVLALGLAATAATAYVAFGAFLPWREEEEAKQLAELAGVRPGHSVAEIGAGTGRFTVSIARAVGTSGKVFSTELNPERRRDIRDRAAPAGLRNVTVIEASADGTNLPDASCDVVFLRNVYHHIREPERFAASIARALKPGGLAVVIDFEPGALWLHGSEPDEAGRRPGHGVSRTDAIAEFRTAGFEPQRDVPRWSGPMWLVVFQRRESISPRRASGR